MRLIDADAMETDLMTVNPQYQVMIDWCMQVIKAQPTIDAKPVIKGKWIRWYENIKHDGSIEHMPHCKCSECGKEYDPHSSQFIKYCNECGARMEVEE